MEVFDAAHVLYHGYVTMCLLHLIIVLEGNLRFSLFFSHFFVFVRLCSCSFAFTIVLLIRDFSLI